MTNSQVERRGQECANLIKHKPFMDLYLINAATDAKRQPCLDMTETRIWDWNEVTIQRRETRELIFSAQKTPRMNEACWPK